MIRIRDEQIETFFQAREERLLEDLASLVALPSVVEAPLSGRPYGKPARQALTQAASIASRLGFRVEEIDDCCMTADFGDRPLRLSLLGHLDVVAAGQGWTRPPYALTREGPWLYGRGVADNKGPCVMLLYAMAAARALHPRFPFSPQVWLGTAEEVGSPDLKAYLQKRSFAPYVLTPDALEPVVTGESAKHRPTFFKAWAPEPVSPGLVQLQGGTVRNAIPGYATAVLAGLGCGQVEEAAAEISAKTQVAFDCLHIQGDDGQQLVQIQARGRASHIGRPQLGRNAQTALIALLNTLPLAACEGTLALEALGRLFPHDDSRGAALGLTLSDAFFGPAQVNFTVCSMDERGIRCKMDARGPLASRPENFSQIIDEALADKGFEVVPAPMEPAHFVPADAPVAATLCALYEAQFGLPVSCTATTGASYAHYVPGAISTGVAAPGTDTRLHQADERIPLEELLQVGAIYTRAILAFCGGGF